MSLLPEKTDVFPSNVLTDSADVRELPEPPVFQHILRDQHDSIYAFVIYLDFLVVYYKLLDWNAKMEKHFLDTGSYVKSLRQTREKSWSWAARRLRKDVSDTTKTNTDVRTSFKWKKNFFLVKPCFTFGQRTVKPGTVHVYQIGAVELKFFFVDRRNRFKKLQIREKLFPADDERYYCKRILYAHTRYCVPENTSYVIYCTDKSLFSVHVVESGVRLPFSCVDPVAQVSKRKFVDTLYRRPIKTPMIEDAMVAEEEEEDVVSSSSSQPPEAAVSGPASPRNPFRRYRYPPPTATVSRPPPSPQPAENDLPSVPLTDDALMPPPPPPAPTATYVIAIPLEKTVRVVTPPYVEWYRTLQNREFTNPALDVVQVFATDSECQAEPLDLTRLSDEERIETEPAEIDVSGVETVTDDVNADLEEMIQKTLRNDSEVCQALDELTQILEL